MSFVFYHGVSRVVKIITVVISSAAVNDIISFSNDVIRSHSKRDMLILDISSISYRLFGFQLTILP